MLRRYRLRIHCNCTPYGVEPPQLITPISITVARLQSLGSLSSQSLRLCKLILKFGALARRCILAIHFHNLLINTCICCSWSRFLPHRFSGAGGRGKFVIVMLKCRSRCPPQAPLDRYTTTLHLGRSTVTACNSQLLNLLGPDA